MSFAGSPKRIIGRLRIAVGPRRPRWYMAGRLIAVMGMLMGVVGAAQVVTVASATTASAASTPASALTKTGTDPTTGSTATGGGAAGTTQPGDPINWVLHYANNTGAQATVNQTDPITGPQSYVPGSLKTPPTLSPQYSTDGGTTWAPGAPPAGATGVGATGTAAAGTTAAQSPVFNAQALSFTTPGGDGYSVEGQGNKIYTVFHHTGPGAGNGGITAVYCATLAGAACPGWPAVSTYVNPTAGTPIGTGGPGPYTTAGENGSFIASGNLYWPVEDTVASGGQYTVGLQCLNLTTLVSCGFTQLDTTTLAPTAAGTSGAISSDGIPAGNGDYYFFDGNGNMLCFNPASGACGSANVTAGGPAGNPSSYLGSMLTSGSYVFQTYVPTWPLPAGPGTLDLTCYNTATASVCPNYPISEGASVGNNPDYLAPVLDDGSLIGICDVAKSACYTPTGTPMSSDPYAGYAGFGDLTPGPGFGSGAIVGSRFYTAYPADLINVNTTTLLCFDFAAWSGSGPVPQCSGFTGQVDEQNYTVRSLANLPGCMAADGNLGHIVIFNAQTGGSCVNASQSVALNPNQFYCDGLTNHATSWGTVKLNGLTGSEYESGTITLTGANGPVPGYTDLPLTPGQTTLDLSSLPVSGNTASLTAQVALTGVTNTAAVNAAALTLSWAGDPIETCFQTTVDNFCPTAGMVVSNTGNVVTTGSNSVTDGPGGASSGAASFALVPTKAQCSLAFTKTPSQTDANPGDTVVYTLTVQNNGTVPWTAANPAQFNDSLVNVVTDATYKNDAAASTGTVGYDAATSNLSWSGALNPGDTATITYSVTVNKPDTGPHSLANQLTPVCPAYANCPPPPQVVVPVAGFKVVKTTPDLVATPGEKVTYTVTVTNTGQVAFPDAVVNPAAPAASFTDDLTGDLNDATFNNDAVASGGTVSYSAPTLSWSGSLPVGGEQTITYSVTVGNPDTGSHTLNNAVTGGDNCQVPAADPSECMTSTPVADYQVVKTSSPSATPLTPGDTVNYTVTAVNKGSVAYPDPALSVGNATWTDNLTGDLGDAVYNNDASAGAGTLTYTAPNLAWSGPLPVGQTVTATYSVTINNPDTGPHGLNNTVTGGSNCTPPSANPTQCTTTDLIQDFKTVKTASVQTANPGDVVTYTVAVINTGQVAYSAAAPATFTDDLTGDLQDASYNNDAKATAGTVSYATPKLSWSAPLAVGQTVTVTYSVTVNDPDTGPHSLTNVVTNPTNCPAGSTDPACGTVTPVSGLTFAKTASAATANPGDTVTYKVTVTNTGQVAYTAAKPASFTDDLTNDLTDAAYNGDASATFGTVSYTSPNLSWSGPLAIAATATVTYTVKVNNPDTGPHDLVNPITSTVPGTNCTPPSTDPACSTNTPVAGLKFAKTASAATANPGDTVTYTVTVTNTGQVAYTAASPASFTDDLTNDLTDAVYNGDASATAGTVSYASPKLSWSGPVPVAGSVTVTYSVKVDNPDTGPLKLVNPITSTIPGTNCTPPSTDPACSTVTPVVGTPSVSLLKTASVSPAADQSGFRAGDSITYTFKVTNTGNVDLKSVAVNDPTGSAVTCPVPAAPGLAPGASETCTGDTPHVVTTADVAAGKVTDTATATGTDPGGTVSAPSNPSTAVVPAATAAAALTLTPRAVTPVAGAPATPARANGLGAISTDLGRWLPGSQGGVTGTEGAAGFVLFAGLGVMVARRRRHGRS